MTVWQGGPPPFPHDGMEPVLGDSHLAKPPLNTQPPFEDTAQGSWLQVVAALLHLQNPPAHVASL